MRVQGKENGKDFAKKAHWNRMFLQGIPLFLSCNTVFEPYVLLSESSFVYAIPAVFMRLPRDEKQLKARLNFNRFPAILC
jgi:hypothetical protein